MLSPVTAGARLAGLSLAVLTALAGSEARAQQPANAAAAGSAWSRFEPGRGWVTYAPGSAPATTSAPAAPPAGSYVAPGWAGYAPVTAWYGYAPASSPYGASTVAVTGVAGTTAAARGQVPVGPSRRRAANRFVNHTDPALAYAQPSYREYGTGRGVPLAKPFLPSSP